MNYKNLINRIAFYSNSNAPLVDELSEINIIIRKHYSEIEYKIIVSTLIDKLNEHLKLQNEIMNQATYFGTQSMDYTFEIDDVKVIHTRKLSKVVEAWKLAIKFLSEVSQSKNESKITLNFNELPDYLSDEMLSELMGWSKSTIQTKHSRNELARVEGTNLTPKKGLEEYLQKKTRGLYNGEMEKWKGELLQDKRKKSNR